MKNRLFVFLNVVFIILFFLNCQGKRTSPCRLYIYGCLDKVYQIDFDGNDSIETICGDLKQEAYDSMGVIRNIQSPFSDIYMQKSIKINEGQAACLVEILERLNSKLITDTIKGDYRDVWNVRLFLAKQNVNLQTYGIKDPDIQMLVDSLKEYSPIFINDYSNHWWGLEKEEKMIRMYDKRRK